MSDWGPKTIFLDIDGVLLSHAGALRFIWDVARDEEHWRLLPGVQQKLQEWDEKGYKLILTTGRRECMRKDTEAQLAAHGIFYDQLVMGVGRGQRVIINDFKKDSEEPTAVAICVKRDEGLVNVEI
jgi:histidinol phosphatase-like enzyme